jgi:glycosyltransferase involved in cell wall biosynthesis
MNSRPVITVCIPAYNRAGLLGQLIDSILNQDFDDFNILICEDYSPERATIAGLVHGFQQRHPERIRYEENVANLGYDGNIRRLVELASGQYCLFMGNDDLMCAGALATISAAIQRQPDCGVVVRSYATFDVNPNQFNQVYRYFPIEHVLPAGAQAIFTAYRRSVVIPGMVINRDAALAIATDRFDGTLLYQLYLVGIILAKYSVVFVPQIIALRRDGTPPDFGNSAAEKGNFIPHDQTPASSIHFMQGMLSIAKYVEEATQLNVFEVIRTDIGNYSYPILSIQVKRPLGVFIKYGMSLAKSGLWRYPLFYFYFLALVILGSDRSDSMIKIIKKRLGHTPRFGAARIGRL